MNRKNHSSEIDNFDPRSCISLKMMKCNRIVANVFRKHLSQFNITDSQLSIVFVIAKANNVNQKKLSEKLFLEKSTINRNISRLLKSGIVTYSDHKELNLTDNGKELLIKVIPHWENAMKEIKSILDLDGEEALHLLTGKLTN